MKLLELKNNHQRVTTEKHSFFEYIEVMLFVPVIVGGFMFAKASLWFRVGRDIGKQF